MTNAGTILVAAGVPASDGVAFGAAASNASLTNAAQGYVTGVLAVLGAGSADSVLNGGTLLAGSMGVYLKAGGQVTNQGGGLIQGTGQIPGSGLAAGYGVRVIGAAGTVSNSGTIYGRNSAIALTAGGMIANQVGALIKNQVAKSAVITIPVATAAAIAIIGPTAGTVVNAGTIGAIGTLAPPGGTTEDLSGAFAAVGVTSGSGLYLSNLSTGLIAGVYGVLSAGGPASLSNAGTIQEQRHEQDRRGRGWRRGQSIRRLPERHPWRAGVSEQRVRRPHRGLFRGEGERRGDHRQCRNDRRANDRVTRLFRRDSQHDVGGLPGVGWLG